MSIDRDPTRLVRSWLEEGVTTLPDRVLDAVLDQVPATQQRRPWWPARRDARMNNILKFALAAAAVMVVALAGYNLLPRQTGFGAPPTVTPQPTSTGSPSPTVGPLPIPSGSMAAGTYLVSDASLTIHPYTLTVPPGWIGGDGARRGDMSGTGVRLTTWIITDVYANTCHWLGTLVPVSDKASLVAAFAAQVGLTHSTPVETTIGGLPATKVTLTLPATFDVSPCYHSVANHPGVVRVWPDPGPDESGGFAIIPGQTTTVYILEASRQVMVLMTVQRNDSPAADVATLQQILASVKFLP